MKYAKMLGLGLFIAALGMTGCAKDAPKGNRSAGKDSGEKESHEHGKGPNGGVVFDLGKYHAEFTVNHDKKECMLLILGKDEKTVTPIAAKEVLVTTKETKTKEGKIVPPMTIKMLPKDEKEAKASKFVGTDPGLGNVADFEGTIIAEIDGKPARGSFKEE
jgi:hypothetical protein